MKKLMMLFTIILLLSLLMSCNNKKGVGSITSQGLVVAAMEEIPTVQSKAKDEKLEEPVELTILAAASLTEVTEKLAYLYKTSCPNVTLTFSYGASGALQTQIEEGAPADLFLSAASKQMDALEEKELILQGTRKDLLTNELVLIVPRDSSLSITGFEDLAKDSVNMVALGEPKAVPAGQYAEEVFTTLGILDAINSKINYGSDVKQVLTWVETKEVDCGVVYASDAMGSDQVTVVCTAPAGSHKEIVYPTAVLKDSSAPEAAKAFLDFLSSNQAKKVFEEFGFKVD